LPKGWLRGTFEVKFPAESADGYLFDVRADGLWRRRSLKQHAPEEAAASYVIEKLYPLAKNYSVLAATSLERKANAYLGKGANIEDLGTRLRWAQVSIDVDPKILLEASNLMRIRSRAKADLEDRDLRIARAVALRDLLREDPTLAFAHLLLEAPEKIDVRNLSGTIKAVGEQISAYAPGETWVKTAQLLERSFGSLPADAKQAIIDRICKTLTEFGEREPADHIRETYSGHVDLSSKTSTLGARAADLSFRYRIHTYDGRTQYARLASNRYRGCARPFVHTLVAAPWPRHTDCSRRS
jgi:hypothetical protein